jgi:tetratricopeptide (TPR) repeat protein
MPTSENIFPKELTGHLTEVALGYQRMLQDNPCDPKALVGMTLVALASRQSEAAVKMARAALAVAPRMNTAWLALGQALKASGRREEAEQAYRQAISLDGMNALARMSMGELMLACGRSEEAIKQYELALRKQPALATAHMGIGHALAMMRRYEEALSRYEQALALRPRLSEAHFAAGFALSHLGKPKQAVARYRLALSIRPDFAAAWMNLGSLLREQGNEFYAEAALQRAVELCPDLISGWINLAIFDRERHNSEKAEADLRKAFSLNPEQVETMVAWCQFRSSEGDLAGAWEWLRWAIARDPDNLEAMNMHGILLHNERRFEEAVVIFEQAEALGHQAAASNRGNALLDLGRMEEALRAQELAVKRDPAGNGAKYNLALTCLRLGDWKRGWPEYEARWDFHEVHPTHMIYRQPRWRGEPLKGRRILLYAEQGLGDAIQFSRYTEQVVARGGQIILQVREPVQRLMASLAVVRSGQAVVAPLGIEPPAFDVECPLMSLPAAFGTTIETVPWSGAYLEADPALVSDKIKQFPALRPHRRAPGEPLRVGFAWAGNPRYRADSQRSTNVSTLLPLLRTPGVLWVSLQKGAAAEQLAALPEDVHVLDGCSGERDLAETAAVISTLDLVITTDTCSVHLAGAMAKPVWVLLPHLSDWRWMQEIETTPWYPTARLFRQHTPGDWAGVLDRVIGELSELRAAGQDQIVRAARQEPQFSELIPA